MPIMVICLKLATVTFNANQASWWHEYLKVTYVPHFDKKAFGRPGPGSDQMQRLRNDFRHRLRTVVYDGQTPFQIVRGWVGGGVLLWLGVFVAGWMADQDRLIRFRTEPRNLRGTRLVSVAEFQKTIKDPGLGIWVEEPKKWYQRKKGNVRLLQISRSVETQHLQTIGDSGSGKTLVLLSILNQAEIHGETCVVLDPHLQFVPLYYRPERGDVILNPTDERCASWNPSHEIDRTTKTSANATAQAQAASIYPGSETDSNKNHWFFVDCARRIWTHLMELYEPDAARMAMLMEHVDPLIDAVTKGTSLEEMLKKNADGQRAAVTSTLTAPLFALKQIPENDGERPVWSAREWSKVRTGWVFITSTLNTRTSLAPIQRLWINSIMQELLSQGDRPDLPVVRMVLDELPTVGELGMLSIAYAEGRKAGMTLAVAFQGRSGIRALYGERAEGIFSSAYTQLLLRTRDPDAAEWGSKLLGEFEGERLNEHVSPDGKRSYTAARLVERVVIAAEVAGLEPRHGWLRNGNYTVPVTVVPPVFRPNIAEAFIPCAGLAPITLQLPNLEELRASEQAERETIAAAVNETMFGPGRFEMPEKKRPKGKGKVTGQKDLYGTSSS